MALPPPEVIDGVPPPIVGGTGKWMFTTYDEAIRYRDELRMQGFTVVAEALTETPVDEALTNIQDWNNYPWVVYKASPRG